MFAIASRQKNMQIATASVTTPHNARCTSTPTHLREPLVLPRSVLGNAASNVFVGSGHSFARHQTWTRTAKADQPVLARHNPYYPGTVMSSSAKSLRLFQGPYRICLSISTNRDSSLQIPVSAVSTKEKASCAPQPLATLSKRVANFWTASAAQSSSLAPRRFYKIVARSLSSWIALQ